MNAKTLIVGAGAGHALVVAALAALSEARPNAIEELRAQCTSHEGIERSRELGFMEFFDWLASTDTIELNQLYREHCGLECVDLATNPHARERVGLEVWRKL